MNEHFKEQIERLSPAQQDELARLAAKRVSRRLALLRQTRSCRAWQYLLPLLMVGAAVAFVSFPSIRSWVLLATVLVLSGLVLAINLRLDAITELLERDLERAAADEEAQRR